MTHLARELQRLCGLHQPPLRQIDICRKTGLSRTVVNLVMTGKQKFNSDETFAKLVAFVGRNQLERADLVAARMKDMCVTDGGELIEILIKKGKKARAFEGKLDPKAAEAIEYFAKNVSKNSKLRAAVVGLYEILQP